MPTDSRRTTSPYFARSLRWTVYLLLAVGLVLIILWAARLVQIGLSLRTHLAQGQAMAQMADPSALDPVAACGLAQGLDGDVRALRREAGALVNAAPAFSWLPKVGAELRAAPQLMALAENLGQAATLACRAATPALAARQAGSNAAASSSMPETIALALEDQASWAGARAAVERAQASRDALDAGTLSPTLAGPLALLDRGLPLADEALSFLTVAPQLLGMDRPRTYLVLALNEDELRPGGGFITGVGEVQVEAGRVITTSFRDSYTVDDFSLPYPDPPAPLQNYLKLDLWVLRDSNWSPDFPTSARQALELYRPPGGAGPIDGVIAIDQQGVQGLVQALGSLSIGDGETVTGATLIPFVRRAWAPPTGKISSDWAAGRKSFMGPLAAAAQQRLESGEIDWSGLVQAGLRLLEQRHVQIYFSDADAQAVLAEQGRAGALREEPGDFLALVDANVGYNKSNGRIRQSLAYQVDLRQPQPLATLTVTYTHTSTRSYACRPEIRWDTTYDLMMDRCYWDYGRVYVPAGATLLEANAIPVPAEATWSRGDEPGTVSVGQADEGPWQTLEALTLVPPASTVVRSYKLTVAPGSLTQAESQGQYTLRVRKQAGTLAYPVLVSVRLPEGNVAGKITPAAGQVVGDRVVFRVNLDRDQTFTVRWQRPIARD